MEKLSEDDIPIGVWGKDPRKAASAARGNAISEKKCKSWHVKNSYRSYRIYLSQSENWNIETKKACWDKTKNQEQIKTGRCPL